MGERVVVEVEGDPSDDDVSRLLHGVAGKIADGFTAGGLGADPEASWRRESFEEAG